MKWLLAPRTARITDTGYLLALLFRRTARITETGGRWERGSGRSLNAATMKSGSSYFTKSYIHCVVSIMIGAALLSQQMPLARAHDLHFPLHR
eukprot:scaffold1147_cov126-Cylindrotheca_fusiformis.AAC.6